MGGINCNPRLALNLFQSVPEKARGIETGLLPTINVRSAAIMAALNVAVLMIAEVGFVAANSEGVAPIRLPPNT